jgi:hypothetical protein
MKKVWIGVGVLFILVLLALLGGYIYSFIVPHPEVTEKYEIFRDVLTIVLAIAALFIAAAGYCIYRYLDERITRHAIEAADSAARIEGHFSSAYSLGQSGYIYWRTYKKTKDTDYLENAISFTELAYRHAIWLNEQQREHQRLICAIRNNLGYYLAERGKMEDGTLARECAAYIKRKIVDFPEARAMWEDTYSFILEKYPTTS